MNLIFVRHGPKDLQVECEDADRPLDASAVDMARRLSAALEERSLKPRYIVSSRFKHAMETAELLRAKRTRRILPVTALTPGTPEADFTMSTVLAEAFAAGVDLMRGCDVLMLVGHETRLSQLAGQLTGQTTVNRQLGSMEALIIDWYATPLGRIAP